MENLSQFSWVDFYKEFASVLKGYKDDRSALIQKLKTVFESVDIKLPTLEKDNQIVDIDPFTVFGLFNKSSMKESNRVKIISAVAEKFGVRTDIPTSFDSIPVLNNQNATFYHFVGDRAENDIYELWELFEAALMYADNTSSKNREVLSKYFDLAINKKGNGNSKITMGLYWMDPNSFLNLDQRNTWYIYESGKIPAAVVSTLPAIESKIKSQKYFDIVEKLRSYLSSSESDLKDFKELSFEAWRYSEEVNKQNKAAASQSVSSEVVSEISKDGVAEYQSKPQNKGAAVADEKVEKSEALLEGESDVEDQEIFYPTYDSANFLEEVYMEEDSYKKLVALLKKKKNVILQGAPGVGKTYAAKRLAYSIIGKKNKDRIMMVQFHQSYSYEDFIMGFRPTEKGFELKKGTFYSFCKKAEIDSANPYFFIIDEINRGNMSKIFGELFMLIESDKRGVELQLPYSDEKFSVPDNIYIIGMMNTADRSLAMLDYALRRRFAFYEMNIGFDSKGFNAYRMKLNNTKFDSLINCVNDLNNIITADDSLGEGFRIGHSYFCNLSDINEQVLSSIVEYELIPLLKEYWFDEPLKVKDWIKKLGSVIK